MGPYTQRARPFGHALLMDDSVTVATEKFTFYCPSPGIRAAL